VNTIPQILTPEVPPASSGVATSSLALSASGATSNAVSTANSTQFVTQLAQFSQLSALSSMQSDLNDLVQAEQAQSAPILSGAALLGKTVMTPGGSGVVQGAAVESGNVYLTVSGQSEAVPLTAITAVTDAAASSV